MRIPGWLHDLTSVIYPDRCPVCGCTLATGEHTLCLKCFAELPRTGIHTSGFNEIHRRTAHRTHIERAAAFFHYERHSPYSGLIHMAKYRNRPRIAEELAETYAREIAPSGFFDGIGMIEPVPLHWLRQIARGYNQSLYIAHGISAATGIPGGDHLRASRLQRSQTHRSAQARHQAAEGLYHAVYPEELKGQHILIVDDVITTGSTVRACCNAIAAASPDTRCSILALSLSRND